MKTIVCFFISIFLLIVNCSSQDSVNNGLHISNLPAEGIILDKGWKFAAGDSPNYAMPEYDDSKWQLIDPSI